MNIMVDFGILGALRSVLQEASVIQDKGLHGHIHLNTPPGSKYPAIVLEIEEIWTNMMLVPTGVFGRLKLKASMLSENIGGRESIEMASLVEKAIDGKKILLKDGKEAIMRLEGSIIDMPNNQSPRAVQQYYQALIRG